jgi:plasmid maintenance system antidote protein VapI
MTNQMRPIHPGEALCDELEEIGMTANSLAGRLDIPPSRITAILNARHHLRR